ncbi:MAG: ATP-binding protein [Acidobacteriota bacterium]
MSRGGAAGFRRGAALRSKGALDLLALVAISGSLAVPTFGAPLQAEEELRRWHLRFGDDPSWSHPDLVLDPSWHQVSVPGSALQVYRQLRDQGAPGVPDRTPFYVWYRTRFVTPPDAGDAPLGLFLGRLEDVDQTFVNGLRVGWEGLFDRWPIPDKARGYPVPPGALAPPGESNVLAVRVQLWSSSGGMVADVPFVAPRWRVIERREQLDRQSVVIDAGLVAASASNLVLWLGLWFFGQRNREHVLLGWVLVTMVAMQALEGLGCYFVARSLDQAFGATTGLAATPVSEIYPFVGLPIWTAGVIFVLHYLWSLVGKAADRWLWGLDALLVVGSLATLAAPGERLGIQIFLASQAVAVVGALLLFLPAALRSRRAGTPGITAVATGFAILTVGGLFYGYSSYQPILNRAVTRASMVVFAMTLLIAFAQRHRSLRSRADHLGMQLVDSADQVQSRVARDLHDGVVQRLAAHGLSLRHAVRQQSWSTVSGVIDELGGTSDEVRAVVHELRPALLQRFGLRAAIVAHCEEVARAEAVEIEVVTGPAADFAAESAAPRHQGEAAVRELPALSAAAEVHVFRIVQEALNNSIRHAGAGRIRVELQVDPAGTLDLAIVDDGQGITPHQRQTGGLGLSIMKERAMLIRGRFELLSRPGGGTAIRVRGVQP